MQKDRINVVINEVQVRSPRRNRRQNVTLPNSDPRSSNAIKTLIGSNFKSSDKRSDVLEPITEFVKKTPQKQGEPVKMFNH